MTDATNLVEPNALVQETKASPKAKSAFLSVAGFWQIIGALFQGIQSIQDYVQGLLGLSSSVETLNLNLAKGWFANLQEGLKKIETDIKDGGKDMGAKVNKDMTAFNLANTIYQQSNTFYSGIGDGINRNTGDASQTISQNTQMFEQGPLTTLQIIAQTV